MPRSRYFKLMQTVEAMDEADEFHGAKKSRK